MYNLWCVNRPMSCVKWTQEHLYFVPHLLLDYHETVWTHTGSWLESSYSVHILCGFRVWDSTCSSAYSTVAERAKNVVQLEKIRANKERFHAAQITGVWMFSWGLYKVDTVDVLVLWFSKVFNVYFCLNVNVAITWCFFLLFYFSWQAYNMQRQ